MLCSPVIVSGTLVLSIDAKAYTYSTDVAAHENLGTKKAYEYAERTPSRLNVDPDLVQQRCASREQHLSVINGVTQSVTRDERRLQVRRA